VCHVKLFFFERTRFNKKELDMTHGEIVGIELLTTRPP